MIAAGPMSSALETARKQLADCVSYQAFAGVFSSIDAIARTYLASLPPPANGTEYTPAEYEATLRPFGIIYTASAGGYSLTRSALYAQRENGRLFIELEITIPAVYMEQEIVEVRQQVPRATPINFTSDLETADRWILNQVGQIVWEFMELSGKPGYLNVSTITVMMGPSRERHEEPLATGYYYWTLLEVTYGATE